MALRTFSSSVTLADAAAPARVRHPFLRTGVFTDPRYGEFRITQAMLEQGKANFDAGLLGRDITLDVAHEPDHGAAAVIKKLTIEPFTPPTPELAAKYRAAGIKPLVLMAELEFTGYGVEAVKDKGFRYISAEYDESWMDNETATQHGVVILGGGLTTRPVQRHQPALQLSETDTPAGCPALFFDTGEIQMDIRKKLSDDLGSLKLSETVKGKLLEQFDKAQKRLGENPDADLLKGVADDIFDAGKTLKLGLEEGKQEIHFTLSEVPAAAPATPAAPAFTEADIAGIFAKKMAEAKQAEIEAARQLAETTQSKRKLFAETVKAAQLGEHEATALADMDSITPDMGDGVVKKLAEQAVKLAQAQHAAGAADFLKARGFETNTGIGHIRMNESNEIKALSEHIRKAAQLTDSQPRSEANRKLAEEVLARFDAEHGYELSQEHKLWKKLGGRPATTAQIKQLAAGTISVSDAAVPTSYIREVIRETLYNMVALDFCNVATGEMATAVDIPYSYRDTSAKGGATSGVNSPKQATRIYEGQAIGKAQEIITSELAYPIPIKLAVRMSDEYRLLAGQGRDWDAIADNMRNTVRIVGEAKDAGIFDEILQASDEYSKTAVVAENLELQADDAKKIFILAGFPVCRPRKVYDLKGAQIGSTVNPITVTYNSVALSEYDGTGTQAAGTYYVLDYNLGEIYLVNQAGAVQTPANGTAYTISYSYTTNVYKFDTDLGTDTTGEHWRKFLYYYGQRQALITDTRYHMANMGLMSRTAMNSIRQATDFQNYYKDGSNTNIRADGSLGFIWDTENYNTRAPGVWIGDNRIVIGEKGTTRFRMLKPWEMGELESITDSSGNFTGEKGAYGSEWVVIHTPTQLKKAYTSMVIYSASARVARAS